MFKLLRKKIGIIGYGNMGSAIAERIKHKYHVFVFDKDKNKIQNLPGIIAADNIKDFMDKIDVVIIAVKPQDFDSVLSEIKNCIGNKLIISIAAGIKTECIEKKLGKIRVIRVMPNLPDMFGKGVNCLCKGGLATDKDLNIAQKLFKLLGSIFIFNEDMMNTVTGVSGSGPGFVFDFLEKENMDYHHISKEKIRDFSVDFKKAAELVGLSKKDASRIVDDTIAGSLVTISAMNVAPAVLREKVASKGGTTEAGLEVLRAGGSLEQAVRAAVRRAEELSFL